MQKVAQSQVLTSVLIIALLIASITIIYISAKDYIINLSPVSCIDLQTKSIITSTACYNQTSSKTQVRLNRNSESLQIDSIDFILDNQEFICSESCQNCAILLPDSSKTYEIDSGKELKIFVNNCELKTIQIQDC